MKTYIFLAVTLLAAYGMVVGTLKVDFVAEKAPSYFEALANRASENAQEELLICKAVTKLKISEVDCPQFFISKDIVEGSFCKRGYATTQPNYLGYLVDKFSFKMVTLSNADSLLDTIEYGANPPPKNHPGRFVTGQIEDSASDSFRSLKFTIKSTTQCDGFFIHNVRAK